MTYTNNINALDRIIAYSAYSNNHASNTIYEIAQILEIPAEVIRRDVNVLLQNGLLYWNPDPDVLDAEERADICSLYRMLHGSDYNDIAPEYRTDQLDHDLNNNELIYDLITKGLLDRIPFTVNDPLTDNDPSYIDSICIPVDTEEYLAYYNLFEKTSYPKQVSDEKTVITSMLRNKKYISEFQPYVLENLYSIEHQILKGSSIAFKYKPYGSSKVSDETVRPLKLGFDATENRYVVISARNNRIFVHDVECMEQIRVPKEEADSDPSLIDNIRHDKVWGFEYDKCLDPSGNPVEPMRTRVMFYSNEANVINKARRDLAYRNPVKLYTDESSNLIYEDDIFGKDSFLKWILSYGSSVLILEPQSLVNELVTEIKKRIEANR